MLFFYCLVEFGYLFKFLTQLKIFLFRLFVFLINFQKLIFQSISKFLLRLQLFSYLVGSEAKNVLGFLESSDLMCQFGDNFFLVGYDIFLAFQIFLEGFDSIEALFELKKQMIVISFSALVLIDKSLVVDKYGFLFDLFGLELTFQFVNIQLKFHNDIVFVDLDISEGNLVLFLKFNQFKFHSFFILQNIKFDLISFRTLLFHLILEYISNLNNIIVIFIL